MQNTNNFELGTYYHIYNRANGKENLFVLEDNYRYFLKQYHKYIFPIANTYAYCLMPNHFHFLIQIKGEEEIKLNVPISTFGKFETFQKLVSKQFANLFSSYTQAFNKQQDRKGSLFTPNFKRKQITGEEYLKKVLHYIHFNPVKAKLCSFPQQWEFSSFKAIISNQKTNIEKEEVLKWFEDLENYIHIHKEHPDETGINYFNDC